MDPIEKRNIELLGPNHIDRLYVARAIMYFHRNIAEFDLSYFTQAEIDTNYAIEQLRKRNERINS